MEGRKSSPQDCGPDSSPQAWGSYGGTLAEERAAMHLGGEPRILLVCVALSFLLHIWLLAGVEWNDGGSWRASLPVLMDVRIESRSGAADGKSSHQAPFVPDPSRTTDEQRGVRSEVPGVRSHHSTSDRTSTSTMRVREPAVAMDGSHPNIDTKRDTSHTVSAARPGSDPATTTTSSTLDRPIIATAEQYRLALILVARRERDRVGFRGLGEGRARIRLDFGSGGMLHVAQVVASSGHEALDAEALRLFGRAHQNLPVPGALLAKPFSIEATVSFERE